jgi:putative polyhydroxyalkanoate system protein
MSTIDLRRPHALTMKRARLAAQKVADELSRDYGMTSEWDGNVLRFHRTGVTGELIVDRRHVELRAKLGFLLAPFRHRIEEQIHRNFDDYFA